MVSSSESGTSGSSTLWLPTVVVYVRSAAVGMVLSQELRPTPNRDLVPCPVARPSSTSTPEPPWTEASCAVTPADD